MKATAVKLDRTKRIRHGNFVYEAIWKASTILVWSSNCRDSITFIHLRVLMNQRLFQDSFLLIFTISFLSPKNLNHKNIKTKNLSNQGKKEAQKKKTSKPRREKAKSSEKRFGAFSALIIQWGKNMALIFKKWASVAFKTDMINKDRRSWKPSKVHFYFFLRFFEGPCQSKI